MGLDAKMPIGAKEHQYPANHDNKCSSTGSPRPFSSTSPKTDLKNDKMANHSKYDAELTIEGAISGKKRGREHLPPISDAEQKKQKREVVKEEGKDGEDAGDGNGCQVSRTPNSMYASDGEKMKQKLKDQGNATTMGAEHEHEAKDKGKKCKCHQVKKHLRSIEEKMESLEAEREKFQQDVEAEMEKLRKDLEDFKRETDMRFDWLNGAVTVLTSAMSWLMGRLGEL